MWNLPQPRLVRGFGLIALGLWLVGCGSSGQNQPGREALRFNPTLPPAYLEDRYDYALVAEGGQRPYRFTLSGTLPKGLTYSAGRISGVPAEKGEFELTATVEDGNLSSRAVKLSLRVSDTPPPQFDQFVPSAEQDSPFVYGVRIRARESRGFQMQIPLTDLRPTLDTLKAAEGVLYVLRYDPERNLMDLDVAFTQPRTNFEAFRLSIAPVPEKKVRFAVGSVLMALLDKNGRPVANAQPIERRPSEGRYTYQNLLTLARNWGQGIPQSTAEAPPAPATGSTPPSPTPTPPVTEAPQAEAPTQSTSQATEPTKNEPAPATEQPTKAEPAEATQPPATQANPQTSASEAAAPSTSAIQASPPPAAPETRSTSPAAQPSSPAAQPPAQGQGSGLEGDLNNDGRVDQKDLEALRASYAWANVGNPAPRSLQNPPTTPTPNPPNPPQGGG